MTRRRLLLILCGHYVDDNAIIEMACLQGHGHTAFRVLARCMGIQLSDSKRQLCSMVVTFLSYLFDLSMVLVDTAVACAPKLGAHERLVEMIQHIFH